MFFLKKLTGRIVSIFGGILCAFIVLEICLRVIGLIYFLSDSYRNYNVNRNFNNSSAIRILCLGPCYTIGIGVEPKYSYPKQLEELLNNRVKDRSFVVINRGVRGKNFDFFVSRIDKLIFKYKPDIIILNVNSRTDFINKSLFLSHKKVLDWKEKIKIYGISFMDKFKVVRLIDLLITNKGKKEEGANGDDRWLFFDRQGRLVKDSKYSYIIEKAKRNIDRGPLSSKAWIRLASAYGLYALYDKAIVSIKKAIELDPLNRNNYFYLFWYYVFDGEYEQALKLQREVLYKNRHDIESNIQYLLNIRDHIEKKEWFDFELSKRYAEIGEYTNALKYANEALSSDHFLVQCYDMIDFYKYALAIESDIEEDKVSILSLRNSKEEWDIWHVKDLLGTEFFYNYLRYNLGKAMAITQKNNVVLVVENMGIIEDQKTIVERVCKEMHLPLIDLYSAFLRTDKNFFHTSLHYRLNEEGNKFMAEEIYKVLTKERIIYGDK